MSYKNGFAIPKTGPIAGLTEAEIDELANLQPSLTYGQAKAEPPQDFVPAHVAFDKKVNLAFNVKCFDTNLGFSTVRLHCVGFVT